MATEAQRRASDKYESANIKRVVIKLNKRTDEKVIAALESEENVQGMIKELIKRDLGSVRVNVWEATATTYHIQFTSKRTRYEAINAISGDVYEEHEEMYTINKKDLADELNKVKEYEGVNVLNVRFC